MFNLKSIRENNTLKLYGYKKGDTSKPVDELFRAIVAPTGELGFDLSANIEDPWSSGPGKLATAAFNAFGYAPALDVPGKFAYRGSSPIEFTIPCFLVMNEGNPQKEFIDPLKSLCDLMLPERDKELNAEIFNKVLNFAPIKSLTDMLGITSAGKELNLSDYIGECWTLKAPWPFGVFNGDSKILTLRVGALRCPNVVVSRMSVKIPIMLYEQGWPNYLALSLSFKTLRSATVNSIGNMFVSSEILEENLYK